jgi:predicted metal-dependent phosphoesterase TrpH
VVEVHNARCIFERSNRQARDWAATNDKLAGAGSDAHTAAEIGAGFVEVPDFEPRRDSLLAALRQGAVVGTRRSSPLFRLASTYAKLRKRLPLSS